ncbi:MULTISPECIES: hypothetical protein [unclassified Flavobacterium]|uniref:hypothetical protein n=1 Tax=unclassified Flavobacterium TaxID=196869 RepID=UPI0025BA1D17|nr:MULTISPECIES: hypothetical protein [unclassified Flavobacterium]
MEDYSNILVVFVIGLVPTLLTLYLNERVKGSVRNSFDEKLEQLKKEHSKEISQFQAELSYLKSKENFKFTKLHEKRFEVLQKTFEYLNNNLNVLATHISPFKFTPDGQNFDENERQASKQYRDAHNEFLKYFKFNSIYFDEETESLLNSFFQESGDIFNAYDQRQIMKSMGDSLDKEGLLNSAMAYKKIPEIIHPLKKEIEIKFRKLLGE